MKVLLSFHSDPDSTPLCIFTFCLQHYLFKSPKSRWSQLYVAGSLSPRATPKGCDQISISDELGIRSGCKKHNVVQSLRSRNTFFTSRNSGFCRDPSEHCRPIKRRVFWVTLKGFSRENKTHRPHENVDWWIFFQTQDIYFSIWLAQIVSCLLLILFFLSIII